MTVVNGNKLTLQTAPVSDSDDYGARRAMSATRECEHCCPSPPDRLPPRRCGHPFSQPASADCRLAGFAHVRVARRGLVRSARTLAAAAWLSVCAALALPATAEDSTTTQTYTVMVTRATAMTPRVPAAPTNFTAAPGNAQVALSWDAPASDSGVTRHEYRYQTTGSYGNWMQIADSAPGGANEAGVTVTGLVNETAHVFQVHAVNADGQSAPATSAEVTPTPGICDRTQLVQDQILKRFAGVVDCSAVTVADLATVGAIHLESAGLTSLQAGDFAGLTKLRTLALSDNSLSSLPETVFSGLEKLQYLLLADNNLGPLPAGLFSGLSELSELDLNLNQSLGPLPEDVFSGLTKLASLKLSVTGLETVPAELFSGLPQLLDLYLNGNRMTELPAGVFSGLSRLRELWLSHNPVDPMLLTVTVEKVGTDQVRAKVLAAAPFAVDIPVTVANGALAGGAAALRVATGWVESTPVTVTRTAGTTAAVTADVDLTTQPSLPRGHNGYTFARSTSGLPAEILPDTAPAFQHDAVVLDLPENSSPGTVVVGSAVPLTATDADSDALTYTLAGPDKDSFDFDSSTRELKARSGVTYDYETRASYSLNVEVDDGDDGTDSIAVTINLTDMDEQPDKPAKPRLAAVSGSATSLAARWTKPGRNGGPDISGYHVEYREGTSGDWETFTHGGTGVTRTITGLTASTSYRVRVQALNGETPSDWSDPSDEVTPNADVVPPTVVSVAVKSAPQSGDTYGWGETIVFTLTFSQKVRVTGQPQPTLAFDLGRSTREARYTGITDTDVDSDPRPRPRPEGVKVHFAYTVQPGDRDTDGIQVGELASAIDLGGARIQRAADLVDADGHKVDGVDADLAHAALGRLPDHKVDGGTAQPPAGSGITIIDTHGNPLKNNRLTLREGTRGRYGLKLNTRPTHTVRVVMVASDGDPDLQVLPTANADKAITPDEWETPFYLDLRAAIDDDDEENGERFFLNHSSSQDPAYHDLILPDVTVVENDRDNDEETLPGRVAEPPTAAFEGLPARHDGETAFTFRIAFSEAVSVTPEAMRTRVLTVAGGAVTGAARVAGESGVWAITVTPDSREELSITLAPATDCAADGAVCTSDGRALSGGLAHIVSGPGPDEPESNRAATGAPTISGTPQVGEALTASTSGISDADGLDDARFAYQWIRTGADIQGATGSTYTPVAADEGKRLKVRVSFTDGAGHEERLTSAATDAVAAAPPTNTAAAGAPTIGGTAQVGEELTASTSGVSDADGLDDARFAYQWIRTDTDIGGATGSTYTPVAPDEGKRLKVRVSFTDDAGNEERLTSAATDAVAAAPEPLTASFEGMPAEHRGQGSFSFRVAFSEGISISYKTVRDASFRVTGGEVTRARRVDKRRDLWKITVEPDSDGAVTIRLPETTDCGASGAICTGDGRPLSHALSATVAGPVGISVADARVEEGADAVLVFTVTLSRAVSAALTVDYATADGSAHAGDDYRAASGTLTFGAGERSTTIEVAVLDDAHDEGEETLTLSLSNPSSGRVTDAEATGTIVNRDPLPRALLARFGRTAAVHVVEHVEERLAAPREPGFRSRFAGRELRPGLERDVATDVLRRLGGLAGAGSAGAGDPMAGVRDPLERGARRAGAAGMTAGAVGTTAGGGGLEGAFSGEGLLRLGLGGGDVLTGSGFALNRATRHGGILSLWSRGAQSRFAGRDGRAVAGRRGADDDARGRLREGAADDGPVAVTQPGPGRVRRAVAGGQVASSVTGVYPWLGYQATERDHGVGRGRLRVGRAGC